MRKLISATLIAGMLSVLMLSSVAADNWSSSTPVAGNPACDDGFKYENPLGGDIVDGTLLVPGGSIAIDVYNTSDGPEFDFVATGFLVEALVVKGGPNAQMYIWAPPTASDHHLHSPLNPRNGKWYGLSHLCFFGDEKKVTEPDPKGK